jgi:hypothetical protein
MKTWYLIFLTLLGAASWGGLLYQLFYGDSWRWAVGFLAINITCYSAIVQPPRFRR